MIVLIITIIFAVVGYCTALYGFKQLIKVTERLEQVKDREKRLSGLSYSTPFAFHRAVLETCVTVFGKTYANGHFFHIAIKDFPFDPADDEDREFAIREADELIEVLEEK